MPHAAKPNAAPVLQQLTPPLCNHDSNVASVARLVAQLLPKAVISYAIGRAALHAKLY